MVSERKVKILIQNLKTSDSHCCAPVLWTLTVCKTLQLAEQNLNWLKPFTSKMVLFLKVQLQHYNQNYVNMSLFYAAYMINLFLHKSYSYLRREFSFSISVIFFSASSKLNCKLASISLPVSDSSNFDFKTWTLTNIL